MRWRAPPLTPPPLPRLCRPQTPPAPPRHHATQRPPPAPNRAKLGLRTPKNITHLTHAPIQSHVQQSAQRSQSGTSALKDPREQYSAVHSSSPTMHMSGLNASGLAPAVPLLALPSCPWRRGRYRERGSLARGGRRAGLQPALGAGAAQARAADCRQRGRARASGQKRRAQAHCACITGTFACAQHPPFEVVGPSRLAAPRVPPFSSESGAPMSNPGVGGVLELSDSSALTSSAWVGGVSELSDRSGPYQQSSGGQGFSAE